jgi:hypothetical protein
LIVIRLSPTKIAGEKQNETDKQNKAKAASAYHSYPRDVIPWGEYPNAEVMRFPSCQPFAVHIACNGIADGRTLKIWGVHPIGTGKCNKYNEA